MANRSTDKKGKKSNSDAVDVGLDVLANVVLSTLKDVASLSNIPGLSQAAGIATSIVRMVQAARSNKDGFQDLAVDVTDLVYAIVVSKKDVVRPEDVDPIMERDLNKLVNTLASVQEFTKEGTSRNCFMAFIRANVDGRAILSYREKLKQALALFSLQSSISLRQRVNEVAEKQSMRIQNSGNTEYMALRAVGGGYSSLIESILAMRPNLDISNSPINQGDNGVVQQGNGISQRDGGVVNLGNQYGVQMFNHANGVRIGGGAFNGVGGDVRNSNY